MFFPPEKKKTFRDHLVTMCQNYGIEGYQEALNFWGEAPRNQRRNINYWLTGSEVVLSENRRTLEAVDVDELPCSPKEYTQKVAALLVRGASVPEAVLLATLI